MNTNNNRENNLDKWLEKNNSNLSNHQPTKTNHQEKSKKSFFDRFKKPNSKPLTNNAKPISTNGEPIKNKATKENNSLEQNKEKNLNPNKKKKKRNFNAKPNPAHKYFKNSTQLSEQKPSNQYHQKVRFIPLGGLNEVGKNMMAIEYGNDIIILDMGLQFPDEDMLGVDYIVPDITYLKNNMHRIRGVLITHGHLDHIGGISYMAPQLNSPPMFGLKLTMGLIKKHIEEHSTTKNIKLVTVEPKQKFKLGVFTIQFFRVNHSIPDSSGIIIETPEGIVVHTGDFKFDFTPADGLQMDMQTLKWLGTQNVLALFSDSTNSLKPGHTLSEKIVGETLDEIITNTKGRIIIASFSSLIGRMQQILNSAMKNKRQVFVSGRSMVDNIEIATKLGYLKYPKDLIKQLNRSKKEATKENALILTTGSQGEAMSALTRMAHNEHKQVKINSKDTVIFSSNPIIGNERGIIAVVNELSKKGAKVISNQILDVHTTGHGHQEDLKLMLELVKPKYLIPVHGEYYMRKGHKELAIEHKLIKPENVILAENGNVIEVKDGLVGISQEVVPSNYILVDNQTGTLSDIGYEIISDRQAMAANGVISINIPYLNGQKKLGKIEVTSKGFIFMKETKRILQDIQNNSQTFTENYFQKNSGKISKEQFYTELRSYIYRILSDKIERRPLVIINIVSF